jgi:hypothetical protein
MSGFRDKTSDAGHLAKGMMRKTWSWRVNFGGVQACDAR